MASIVAKYPQSLSILHWCIALSGGGAIAMVNYAQSLKDPKEKGNAMNAHKSFGLLTGMLMVPRIAIRVTSKKIPAAVEGNFLEQGAAKFTHLALYCLAVGLPASGLAMGYFNGRGVPFFGLFNVPGKKDATKEDKDVAKGIWEKHKIAGATLEALLTLHVGAVGYHFLKGQNILRRMDPRF